MWLSKFNEWESLNPPSDSEKQSISLLSTVCLDTVYVQPQISRRSETDLVDAQTEDAIIETTQQFLSWFSKIEEEMELGQDDHFK